MSPRVSVVVPAYNAMRFLPQTVESVLAQTWEDFELLIVDDGSSDGTGDWVSQQRDSRIRLVQKPNGGLAAARNTGIATAQGAYIAFLDADDLWEPTKLEQQVACLEAHPKVGLVHTAIRYIYESSDKNDETGQVLGTHGDGDVWREIVVYNPVRCGSTPLVRRTCFTEVGTFEPSLTFSEDWDMWIRIAARYHFAVINEPLTLYRQHSTNMTKGYQGFAPNLEKIIERAFSNTSLEHHHLKVRSYGYNYRYIAWLALAAQNWREAADLHRRAINHYPQLRYTKNSLLLSLNIIKVRLKGDVK